MRHFFPLMLFAASFALTSCGTLSGKTPPPPVAQPCPANLTAALYTQPKIPSAAGFPAPVSAEEREAVGVYLEWLSELAAWGRAGWQRLGDAQAFCAGR